MYTGKDILVKNFDKWTKHGFVTLITSWKDNSWLSSKEKILGEEVTKGQADSHLEHKRTHHFLFPWKKMQLLPTL